MKYSDITEAMLANPSGFVMLPMNSHRTLVANANINPEHFTLEYLIPPELEQACNSFDELNFGILVASSLHGEQYTLSSTDHVSPDMITGEQVVIMDSLSENALHVLDGSITHITTPLTTFTDISE